MTHLGKKITLHDMTLRDGMHPKRHLMTLDQMKSIAGCCWHSADRSHPRRWSGRQLSQLRFSGAHRRGIP